MVSEPPIYRPKIQKITPKNFCPPPVRPIASTLMTWEDLKALTAANATRAEKLLARASTISVGSAHISWEDLKALTAANAARAEKLLARTSTITRGSVDSTPSPVASAPASPPLIATPVAAPLVTTSGFIDRHLNTLVSLMDTMTAMVNKVAAANKVAAIVAANLGDHGAAATSSPSTTTATAPDESQVVPELVPVVLAPNTTVSSTSSVSALTAQQEEKTNTESPKLLSTCTMKGPFKSDDAIRDMAASLLAANTHMRVQEHEEATPTFARPQLLGVVMPASGLSMTRSTHHKEADEERPMPWPSFVCDCQRMISMQPHKSPQGNEDTNLDQRLGGLSEVSAKVKEMNSFSLANQIGLPRNGLHDLPRYEGLLLYGPPGTGKTSLASSRAYDLGANSFTINGPKISSQYHGQSEQTLYDVFTSTNQAAPTVILIDELDMIAPARELSLRMVATLLKLMDEIGRGDCVILIAATNPLESIDRALRSPGRFDQETEIGVPSPGQRLEMIHCFPSATVLFKVHGDLSGLHSTLIHEKNDNGWLYVLHVFLSALAHFQWQIPWPSPQGCCAILSLWETCCPTSKLVQICPVKFGLLSVSEVAEFRLRLSCALDFINHILGSRTFWLGIQVAANGVWWSFSWDLGEHNTCILTLQFQIHHVKLDRLS